jgi:hypothetical protein
MHAEAKKLHLIEELLKIDSDAILAEIETIMAKSKAKLPGNKNFKAFVGSLSIDEVNELERNIEDGCEQINEDEWK